MSAPASAKIFRFGPFRLDVGERLLEREGAPVPLLGKAFDTLVLLVEGAGTLQKQHVLIDKLWPDVVVEPNNLQQNVSLVRRALGDAAGVEIETVRGQGYRLRALVREESIEPRVAYEPASAPMRATAAGPGSHLQRIHFCSAHDATRLAYARQGTGRPLVKAANWLSHLEHDVGSRMWIHWLGRLSRDHCLIRYDARGNGLSDWTPPSIRFCDFVSDLGTVFDAAGVQRAPVLGISQGASAAVAYAARHPERVSALILVGGCARGWRTKRHPKLTERMEALMVLMRQGWGAEHPAFRHIWTTSFFPGASKEQMDWLLVLVGEDEILLDDAARVVASAQRAGTDARLLVGRGMQHDWPLTLPWLEESRDAWITMRRFVDTRTPSAPSRACSYPSGRS